MSLWRYERSLGRSARWLGRAAGLAGLSLAISACGSGVAPLAPPLPPPRPAPIEAQLVSPSLVWRWSPAPHTGARATVRRFFASVAQESGPQLEALFAEDALFHRPNQPATPAAIAWLRRLSAGDYAAAAISTTVPIRLLDHAASRRLAAYRAVHLQPQAGEVLAVVSLPAAAAQNAALWGSEMQLVLTPQDGEWQIRELWEDYAPR